MVGPYIVIVLLGAYISQTLVRASEPIAILPPLELRTRGVSSNYISPGNVYTVAPAGQRTPQHQIYHTKNQNVPQARDAEVIARTTEQRDSSNSITNFEDLFRALGLDESEGTNPNERMRAAELDQNQNGFPEGSGLQYPPGYGYPPKPNLVTVPGYQDPAYPNPGPVPEDYHRPSSKTISLLKPLALDFVKPFASKVSTKIGGLLSIVLALLGGSGDTSGLYGLKDIIVNGIIKPLFLFKGGLKALIGKLSIPLISLLLINLEVLITIWWLWEDCGAVHVVAPVPAPVPVYSQPQAVQYPKPVFYNSVLPPNNYNSY